MDPTLIALLDSWRWRSVLVTLASAYVIGWRRSKRVTLCRWLLRRLPAIRQASVAPRHRSRKYKAKPVATLSTPAGITW